MRSRGPPPEPSKRPPEFRSRWPLAAAGLVSAISFMGYRGSMPDNYARDLDLNLLRVFVVVASARSVTQPRRSSI
jgi:hypothetical protein